MQLGIAHSSKHSWIAIHNRLQKTLYYMQSWDATILHIFLKHWKRLSGSIIPHNSGLQMLGPNTIAHTCNPKIKPKLPVTGLCVSKVFVELKKGKDAKQANILAE